MNKTELADKIAKQSTLSKKEAMQCINIITDTIANSVKRGEQVNLPGFGKFKLKYRSEKTAYNPFTKKLMIKSAHKVPVFKCYKQFKSVVNS